MCQQAERDVAVPAIPVPHFILIEADFPFGLGEPFLNRPPHTGDAHQFRYRCVDRPIGPKVGAVVGIVRVVVAPAASAACPAALLPSAPHRPTLARARPGSPLLTSGAPTPRSLGLRRALWPVGGARRGRRPVPAECRRYCHVKSGAELGSNKTRKKGARCGLLRRFMLPGGPP